MDIIIIMDIMGIMVDIILMDIIPIGRIMADITTVIMMDTIMFILIRKNVHSNRDQVIMPVQPEELQLVHPGETALTVPAEIQI